MGVFRQFPYSNFHEMNMDEIIKIVKNMLEEWAQYHAEWDNWMEQMNDDWSNYQEVMNEAWQNMQDFINNYFDNLDVQNEINIKIASMVTNGEFSAIVAPYVPPEVTAWLASHITTPESVVIDTSLSVGGACADAEATGIATGHIISDEVDIEYDSIKSEFGRYGYANQNFYPNNDYVTMWFNVKAGDKVRFNLTTVGSINNEYAYYRCFDASNNQLQNYGNASGQNIVNTTFIMPANASKIFFTYYRTESFSISFVEDSNGFERNKQDIDHINKKINMIGSPELFGAIGDGLNDDTASIQLAIDNFDVVVFDPDKTYCFSQLKIDSHNILDGRGTTLIQKANTQLSGIILKNEGSNNFTIRNFHFIECDDSEYNTASTINKAMIDIEGSLTASVVESYNNDGLTDMLAVIENVKIVRVRGDGVRFKGRGLSTLNNIQVFKAKGVGFSIKCYDTAFNMLDAGACNSNGFNITGESYNLRFTNCKAWGNGYFYRTPASGFAVEGYKISLCACEAQDNYSYGFDLYGYGIVGEGLISDSNGTMIEEATNTPVSRKNLATTDPNYGTMSNYRIQRPCNISGISTERNSSLSPYSSIRSVANAAGSVINMISYLNDEKSIDTVTWHLLRNNTVNFTNREVEYFNEGMVITSGNFTGNTSIQVNTFSTVKLKLTINGDTWCDAVFIGTTRTIDIGGSTVNIEWSTGNAVDITTTASGSYEVRTY